ncbi:MAG: helix-turn-helix domain-containing protein [Actinomycetota bacterium]|nr:helix-turn-helix domain-containing protein [Actinomycetota bacterium]
MNNTAQNQATAPSVSQIVDNPDFAAIARRVMITVEEAASLLGIGRSAAYDAARRGQLPTRRLGRRLFVPVPALLDWLGASGHSEEGTRLEL